MSQVNVLYTSTEGNTEAFIDKLALEAEKAGDDFHPRAIGDETEVAVEKQPYVALVPTYLTGGTGTGPEVTEIFTNALGEYIEEGNNQRYLRGVIGSGNRNFNDQYILTAKRYAKKFNVPLIDHYELRGSKFDAARIYPKIKAALESKHGA
ncbi:class Ib ribonucleoside-diphosphate reductase assembly flavoprotein NrdI [Eupransor demetentiae]|uniref:NrdF-interacting activator of class Ib ribonucleotide reductase (NrdI) n=1 Tax=Eupransor demetentiae TaxID=3109584 RepID=A0ABM9N6B0_9LACO|nr:Flavodoxin NrdI [Lactobacillaceae bacterium LMG 33000]